jgi:hypothetical protein
MAPQGVHRRLLIALGDVEVTLPATSPAAELAGLAVCQQLAAIWSVKRPNSMKAALPGSGSMPRLYTMLQEFSERLSRQADFPSRAAYRSWA